MSELIETIARLPKVCKCIHLPLQSGSDRILRRMNRPYDSAHYMNIINSLRALVPGINFSTDIIVGFPGETEEEFSATLAFLEECRFAAMHVFPYSIRPGTKAADMPQVPGPVKEERAARAGALAARLQACKPLGRVLIPLHMLRHQEDVFLDDWTVPQLSQALNAPVQVVGIDGFDLCDAIFGL